MEFLHNQSYYTVATHIAPRALHTVKYDTLDCDRSASRQGDLSMIYIKLQAVIYGLVYVSKKGTTEDEMVEWHHRLNGLESE